MAHAAPARPAVGHGSLHWTGPVILGLVYGFWAAGIARDGAALSGGNALLGVVCGVAAAVLYYALRRVVAPRLPRGTRAVAWGAFAGGAVGFLHSLSDSSVLTSAVLGLLIAAAVGVTAFYRFYTTES
ncbi:hypothetical protein ABT160_21520 [Streptomyces sp. NPDC001941]|uniref:hypothetical protein n=1 Tax=Streptomyces sp. NPDC001941 TaxID=3154659 RepID=UPI0033189260